MSEEENYWNIEWDEVEDENKIDINHYRYLVKDDFACLTHAILLLVDAVKGMK